MDCPRAGADLLGRFPDGGSWLRGLLFYRRMQQAVAADPHPLKT